MKKLNYLLALSLIAFSCSKKEEPVYVAVNHSGTLMEIMHMGKYQARVSLDTMKTKGIFAVGALDSLRGEILIEDGKLYTSKVVNGDLVTSVDGSETATLLVYAEPEAWDIIPTRTDDLEAVLKETAEYLGVESPFPFMILGRFPLVKYHVINFDSENGDLSQHKEGSLVKEINERDVVILGFYSEEHQGIFTHKDSFTHMHVRDKMGTEMGHLDEIEITNRTFSLLVPKHKN